MELPSWINEEDWNGFVEMRKKIKAPLTERAKRMAIESLRKLRDSGQDPNLVLQQSEFNNWKGLFPVKGQSTLLQQTVSRITDRSWADSIIINNTIKG